MTGALFATAALVGLAGTVHCAGMCAAACSAVGRRCAPAAPRRALAGWWLGRWAAYAAAGVAASTLVQGVRWLFDGSAWLRPFWTLAQVVLVGLGLWLLVRGEWPPTLQQWVEHRRRWTVEPGLQRVHLPGELKAAGTGLLWPLLPCGLLHAALGLAALASGPLEAAGVMTAFAFSSTPGLWAGALLWRRAGAGGPAASGASAVRLAGAGIALLSLWPLAQHAWHPIQAAWCG